MSFINFSIREKDIICLIEEFLLSRNLCMTLDALERETGIINLNYPPEVILLRQMILDGQWTQLIDYIKPMETAETFDSKAFKFAILKQWLSEIACSMAETTCFSYKQFRNDFDECVRELLESYPNAEDLENLRDLMKLGAFHSCSDYSDWNPYSSRMACFQTVYPLIKDLFSCSEGDNSKSAHEERLIDILIKGILYESCEEYCHKRAGAENDMEQNMHLKHMLNSSGFCGSDLSLFCWLQSVPSDIFSHEFAHKELNILIDRVPKPKLCARWGDRMMISPVRPQVFPHTSTQFFKTEVDESFQSESVVSGRQSRSSPEKNSGAKFEKMIAKLDLIWSSFWNRYFRDRTYTNLDTFFLKDGQSVTSSSRSRSEGSFSPPGVAEAALDIPRVEDENCSPPSGTPCSLNGDIGPKGKTVISIFDLPESSPEEDDSAFAERETKRLECIFFPKSQNEPPERDVLRDIAMQRNSIEEKLGAQELVRENLLEILTCKDDKKTLERHNVVLKNSHLAATVLKPNEIDAREELNVVCVPTDGNCRTLIEEFPVVTADDVDEPCDNHKTPSKSELRSKLPEMPGKSKPTSDAGNLPRYKQRDYPRTSVARKDEKKPLKSPKPAVSKYRCTTGKEKHSAGHVSSSSGSSDGTETGKQNFIPVTTLEDEQAIRAVEFHPSGKYYAIGSNTKTLRICAYLNLKELRSDHELREPAILHKRMKQHKGSIYCIAWNATGDLLATGSNDKTIKLMKFNQSTFHMEDAAAPLTMHGGTVRDICFMEDISNRCNLLISGGSGDNKIYVTDCETAMPFQSLTGHTGQILSLYTWGGVMFVSSSQDKTIRFWDMRTRGCVNLIPARPAGGSGPAGSPAATVCVDPSGRLLVSGHEDANCMLYDMKGSRVIQTFRPHTADIRTARLSPKAFYLLTGSYDCKLMLTDLQGDLTQPLPSVTVAEHSDKVIQGRWHPQEFSFLSTSADKTATLWALPPS